MIIFYMVLISFSAIANDVLCRSEGRNAICMYKDATFPCSNSSLNACKVAATKRFQPQINADKAKLQSQIKNDSKTSIHDNINNSLSQMQTGVQTYAQFSNASSGANSASTTSNAGAVGGAVGPPEHGGVGAGATGNSGSGTYFRGNCDLAPDPAACLSSKKEQQNNATGKNTADQRKEQLEKESTDKKSKQTSSNNTAAAKEQRSSANQYFQETENALNDCENSWHSLFTNNCSTTGSTILNNSSSAISSSASAMADSAAVATTAATSAAATVGNAKGACNANLLSCGSLCKKVKVQAANDATECFADSLIIAENFCGDGDNICVSTKQKAHEAECAAIEKEYTTGAVSSVRKCYAAGAAFLAVIAGGIIAINKYKKNAKALKNEVESTDEPNTEAVGSSSQQEEIVWSNGRHQVVSSSKTSSTNNASGSGVTLGESGNSASVQSASRKIADPNPKSDLNFKGYDPNQEYAVSTGSGSSNKLGASNSGAAGASANGQKITGALQAAGASASAVSGSLGSGVGSSGSGVSGGYKSANSELAAYMPGGARDPAAAVNAAQVRAYNEARKQIRFPHSPSNFKAVQSAYDREKNRMGMNSLGVGN